MGGKSRLTHDIHRCGVRWCISPRAPLIVHHSNKKKVKRIIQIKKIKVQTGLAATAECASRFMPLNISD
jgi:hypothetical protein